MSHAHPDPWRLSALLDDELGEGDAQAVTAHLVACDACAEEVERLQGARMLLRTLPHVRPPDDLLVDVAATSAAAARTRRRRVRRVVAAATATAGAVGVVYVAGAGASPQVPRGRVAPPVEVFVIDHVARTGAGPVLTPVDLER